MFEEQVSAGIKVLDRKGPLFWWERIDLEDLNMSSLEYCVLGQLYGNYATGQDSLSLRDEELISLGFDRPRLFAQFSNSHVSGQWEALNEEWKRQIRIKLEAQAQS